MTIDPMLAEKKMNVSQLSYEWPALFLDKVSGPTLFLDKFSCLP